MNINKDINNMNNREHYLAITYRPVGINPLPESGENPYAEDLTEQVNKAIRKALPKAFTSMPTINFRIINVSTALDPRVSTDPGLDSMIYVVHIAYWYR